MILLIDNYDSFTYNLVDYFAQLQVETKVVRNDVSIKEIISLNYQGIVISPGPETPQKSGNLMQVIEYYYQKIPILGICLGHQAIGEFFGATLVKADFPMHGKISNIYHDGNILFRDIPENHEVVRYNSLLLNGIKSPLKIIAQTEAEEVMAIAHISLPIWGVQYHPEAALTQFGLAVLRNWVNDNIVLASN